MGSFSELSKEKPSCKMNTMRRKMKFQEEFMAGKGGNIT
jgi:hypothetical protein